MYLRRYYCNVRWTKVAKYQKVMVAEVVYLLGAYARNPAGCNRRVGGVCSCSWAFRSQICEVEFGYISLGM